MEQQNPYIKQFPELFRDKKIIYVHGYGSSGQSGTVTRIRTVLPGATEWVSQALPPMTHPSPIYVSPPRIVALA